MIFVNSIYQVFPFSLKTNKSNKYLIFQIKYLQYAHDSSQNRNQSWELTKLHLSFGAFSNILDCWSMKISKNIRLLHIKDYGLSRKKFPASGTLPSTILQPVNGSKMLNLELKYETQSLHVLFFLFTF